jgi:hypothetical protein
MVALGALAYGAVMWAMARRRLIADLHAFQNAQALGDPPEA